MPGAKLLLETKLEIQVYLSQPNACKKLFGKWCHIPKLPLFWLSTRKMEFFVNICMEVMCF